MCGTVVTEGTGMPGQCLLALFLCLDVSYTGVLVLVYKNSASCTLLIGATSFIQ